MKRIIAAIALLVMLSTIGVAEEIVKGFTHPEIGEFVVVHENSGAPYFDIYGYKYYTIVDPSVPHRGMKANNIPLIHKEMLTLDQVLPLLLDSLEGKSAEKLPVSFAFAGMAADYADQIKALPRDKQLTALKVLFGFEGTNGFKKLQKLPGFEDIDAKDMAKQFVDYTVLVEGKKYSYRVMMVHVVEDKFNEDYYERYNFLKVGNAWKLARIVKEYAGEYQQRTQYIHGLLGSSPELLDETNKELMRGNAMDANLDDIINRERIDVVKNTISKEETSVYRVPASVAYHFKGKKLMDITYTIKDPFGYNAVFLSLYIRYMDPVSLDKDGNMEWHLNNLSITLNKGDDEHLPTLVVSKR